MKLAARFLAAMICLLLALSPVAAGLAEDNEVDIAQWAAAQEAADHQMEWAKLYGAEVDISETASDITGKCKIRVSEGERSKLTNGRVGSPWKYDHADAWIGITLPEATVPGAIRIEWVFDPKGFELTEYDGSQNELRTRTQADTFPNICTMFPLLPEARMLRLKMTEKGQSVGRIAVYSQGVLPPDVQTWLPPYEKVDMMVFSTHQDDEVVFLGGTIPYSEVVCGRPTVTVYMTNCSRERRREALECLWEMGCRHYPEFINLEDDKVSSIEKGIKLWGGNENILSELVARIRRYKPEVIVTQDLDGEYGHNQHKIMARAMQPAIEAAADPSRFPESFEKYGAWQVKKLYLHLYKENQIRMDWLTPQPACGGLSLLEVARKGMAKHASQTKYYKVKDGGEYDNALYGLAVTTLGPDVAKNDFFENLPAGASEQSQTEDAWTAEPEAGAEQDDAPWDPAETDQSLETEAGEDSGWESVDAAEDSAWEDADAAGDSAWEDADMAEESAWEDAGGEAVQSNFEPPVTQEPSSVAAPPETVRERGGRGWLIAAGAVSAAALAGGCFLLARRSSGSGKRRKKKRRGSKKKTADKAAAKKAGKKAGKAAPRHVRRERP